MKSPIFRIIFSICAYFISEMQLFAVPELTEEVRQKQFSLSKNYLAIGGYDPVSYFMEESPVKGSKEHSAIYRGILYLFSSGENKNIFLKDPERYEPAYGGWCAWAMLDSQRTKPNPKSIKIVNGRLLLFYDGLFGDTLALWNKLAKETPEAKMIEQADAAWANQTSPGKTLDR